MKDYYALLNLPRFASAEQVKRSFRLLALQFHPDRNADPNAEVVFKEINEAYAVLSDPEKKAVYDLKLRNPFEVEVAEPVKPAHRDPAYRRKRPGVKRKGERERMLEMMTRYYPATRWFYYCSFAFCFLLLADVMLPRHLASGSIKYFQYRMLKDDQMAYTLTLENQFRVKITSSVQRQFKSGEVVIVSASRLLNIPLSVTAAADGFTTKARVTIYSTFVFCPLVLLLITAYGWIRRDNIEVSFNVMIGGALILILSCVFLLIS